MKYEFKDSDEMYLKVYPYTSGWNSPTRRDLDDILESYGMENYDEFDLLAFSGGRLFTDAISFAEYTPEILKAKRRLINNDITSKSYDEVESNGR